MTIKVQRDVEAIRKFQNGQKVFIIEVAARDIKPPILQIKEYTISGLTTSTFTRGDEKIVYTVKEDRFVYAFEDRTYTTKEEAQEILLTMIQEDYNYFLEKYKNLIADLDKWKNELLKLNGRG